MKYFLLVLSVLCVGVFVAGGVFSLLGFIFSVTFGVVGTVVGWLFRVLLTPAVLILVIVFLAYKLKRKSV